MMKDTEKYRKLMKIHHFTPILHHYNPFYTILHPLNVLYPRNTQKNCGKMSWGKMSTIFRAKCLRAKCLRAKMSVGQNFPEAKCPLAF